MFTDVCVLANWLSYVKKKQSSDGLEFFVVYLLAALPKACGQEKVLEGNQFEKGICSSLPVP